GGMLSSCISFEFCNRLVYARSNSAEEIGWLLTVAATCFWSIPTVPIPQNMNTITMATKATFRATESVACFLILSSTVDDSLGNAKERKGGVKRQLDRA